MEQWKQIDGHERYFVSSHGRIKNSDGKVLVGFLKTRKGYYKAQLWKGNKRIKTPFVHRLVAIAFIPNPDNLPQVNHKDTNKLNNHVDNLEWCTNQHNADHAMAHGLMVSFKGEKHPKATITLRQAREIRMAILNKNFTRAQLCKKYGVSVHIVKDIRNGRSWNYA